MASCVVIYFVIILSEQILICRSNMCLQGSHDIACLQELLPLMMCAIERHQDSMTRDCLTHALFELVKRPDEQQRRIIIDVSFLTVLIYTLYIY